MYALLAEDRMGELLEKTERSTGRPGPGRGKKGVPAGNALLPKPTLAELGIKPKESMKAQAFHGLPQELKQAVIDGRMTRAEAKRRAKQKGMAEDAINHAPC